MTAQQHILIGMAHDNTKLAVEQLNAGAVSLSIQSLKRAQENLEIVRQLGVAETAPKQINQPTIEV